MVGSILARGYTGRIGAIHRRIRHALRRRAQRRAILREMDCMSDAELAEFGLSRCDLPRIARNATRAI